MTSLDTRPCSLSASRKAASSGTSLLGALAIAALLAAAPLANAAEQRSQAAAQYTRVTMEGYKLQRKDFRFGNFTGWVKRGGEWHIEGPVQHRGLLCGTYEVGMRFGVGKPDCTDVQWVSDVHYVTTHAQCNEAEVPHSGNDIDASLADQFDAISCAERVVRCSGNCK
jgi:hypothetical protein